MGVQIFLKGAQQSSQTASRDHPLHIVAPPKLKWDFDLQGEEFSDGAEESYVHGNDTCVRSGLFM